jgi:hypothetical protein
MMSRTVGHAVPQARAALYVAFALAVAAPVAAMAQGHDPRWQQRHFEHDHDRREWRHEHFHHDWRPPPPFYTPPVYAPPVYAPRPYFPPPPPFYYVPSGPPAVYAPPVYPPPGYPQPYDPAFEDPG